MELDQPKNHQEGPASPIVELSADPSRSEGAESHQASKRTAQDAMDFSSWAAQPAPRRRASSARERLDLDALKIFLILAGLTAGMALALRSLF